MRSGSTARAHFKDALREVSASERRGGRPERSSWDLLCAGDLFLFCHFVH